MISKGIKSIFPIKHQEIWNRYKLHIQSFWTPEEVSLQDDIRDLQTLNEGEKHFIKQVLAFFANSEAMINENIASRFYNEILIPEARCFMSVQMLNESIHAEMYALQIEAYVKNTEEKDRLFSAIENIHCINVDDLAKDPISVLNKICRFLDLPEYAFNNYVKKNVNKEDSRKETYKPMKPETRKKLIEFYKPHNAKLESFLNKKFNWDE